MERGGMDRSQAHLSTLIHRLHATDCAIDDEVLDEILSYGDRAVPHLEAIIREALSKRPHLDLSAAPRGTDWFVVVHALYLLAHLPSEDSLDIVLEFLGQKPAVLDYWLQDLLDDDIWEVLFLLGENQPGRLGQFALDRQNNDFSRLGACTALVQIALRRIQYQDKIRTIFRQLLANEEERPDFTGLVISELMDWRDPELKANILEALARDEVFEGIITAEEVNLLYEKPTVRKLEPPPLLEKYAYFRQYAYFSKAAPEPADKAAALRKLEKSS